MKRTLIISLEYPPQIGGIATYVHDLACALDQNNTIVLAPPFKDSKEWDEQQKYRVLRKKLLFPRFLWPRWVKLCLLTWFLVKKEKIEVVMVHHVLPVGYAAVLLKRFKKTTFILFSHGTDLIAGTATPWKKKMVDKIASHADQITFNSESLKRRFLKVFSQYDNKSLVLYPCPQTDFFNPPPKEEVEKLRLKYALEGKHVILSIARLDEGKGFPHLVRLMPDMLKKDPTIVWMIIGEGPKRQLILDLIQKNSLQNVVRFIGLIPHHEIKTYFYLADLFVLLTHPDEGREEGLGLVFLEAAASGLPAVSGKSGGVEEAVIHTKTGLVFSIFQESEAIKQSIVELLNNKSYAEQLGKYAQDRIKSQFQWEHQIKRLDPWLNPTEEDVKEKNNEQIQIKNTKQTNNTDKKEYERPATKGQ